MRRGAYGTVGLPRPIPAKDRRWKKCDPPNEHLERHSTSYGVETRCRECGRKERGYDAKHWLGCSHAPKPEEPR